MPDAVDRWTLSPARLPRLALATAAAFRSRIRRAGAEARSPRGRLEAGPAEPRPLEDLILAVADGVGVSTGESFLQDLVRQLARVLDVDVAFVGERVRIEDTDAIRTLALFQDGAPREPFAWPVAGSASEGVFREGLCAFPSGVRAAFPADASLRETGLESYVGSALKDSGGRILGLIAVISRKPLANPALTASLLRIFGSRASAELERRRAEQERLDLERQVLHAQKLESLGVLAGGIAHDFNNLLTAMLGHLHEAQLSLSSGAPALRHLGNLERTIQRASELTRQMLAYSGKGRFEFRPCPLSEAVRELTGLLEVSISKKIRLHLDLAEPLPPVLADAAQIQQVVMNLVTNAADAIGDREGTIRLGTSPAELGPADLEEAFPGQDLAPGPYVTLEVADTGCGMSPEVQARIFEPFFTTKAAGRGLGLSATLGILKGHRAGLELRSRPGRGTTFRIYFPAGVPAAAPEPPGPPASVHPAARGTVLLVDDEPLLRETAGSALEAMGCRVVAARDGREAVAAVRQREDLDLVILDLAMPHLDGHEAFRAIQSLRPGLPVILSSGCEPREPDQPSSGPEPAAFLQKPYPLRDLQRAVAEILLRPPAGSAASPGLPRG